jgi:molecular chaperone Hsp33
MGIHLKHNARISLQARGNGVVQLLMTEANIQKSQTAEIELPQHGIRAVARIDNEEMQKQIDSPSSAAEDGATAKTNHNYLELLGKGHLAITIEPEEGERYQGIVAADEGSLKLCLQSYFNQSEQLPTIFLLATNEVCATGILLQRMPHEDSYGLTPEQKSTGDPVWDNLWQELSTLLATLSDQELINLRVDEVLYRLFHEHQVKLSEPDPIIFECSCSYQRTAETLKKINALEIETILEEDGEIIMDCEFCSSRYRFSPQDIAQLGLSSEQTRH